MAWDSNKEINDLIDYDEWNSMVTDQKSRALSSNAMGVVVHGATAGTARPSGYNVITWIGSVEPTNAENDDIWLDVS